MKNYDFESKTLYNGLKAKKGNKTAPFVIENKRIAKEIGCKSEFMETFRDPHRGKYLVAFLEVPEEDFQEYMQHSFPQQINDFFDKYGEVSYHAKFERCIIGGEPCPLSNNCKKCERKDENGNYYRDNKPQMAYFDDPNMPEPSGEDFGSIYLALEDLLQAAKERNPKFPDIIRSLYLSISNDEIIAKLGLKKSQGYALIDQARKFVKEYLK